MNRKAINALASSDLKALSDYALFLKTCLKDDDLKQGYYQRFRNTCAAELKRRIHILIDND